VNKESRLAGRLPNLNFAGSAKRPGRRWWQHPEDPDDELMLVVRSIGAVDRAVDRHRRTA
jgi:hypothetical protein